MEDYGHAIRQRISEKFSDIRWDAHQPVYQSLKSCRMVVIDHPSTTFLETLVADVPTILFWNQFRWEMRDEAEPYFDCLRNAGILWDSPEAAASQVAAVFDEPRSWWDSEAVQEARKCFVDRYALARENWLDCWAQVIQEEVALSQAKKQ
jgi:putative transferase (TIGR04331 family)